MTDVYVDVGAASIESAAPDGGFPPADPEAIRAMRQLAEEGVGVYVITADGPQPAPELRAAAREVLSAVPERPSSNSWYLTSDIDRCRGSSARLRTVFIGGAPPNGSVRRCDAVARDVQTAALEILASEAMPQLVR